MIILIIFYRKEGGDHKILASSMASRKAKPCTIVRGDPIPN
jgi:hypothetical protein